MKFSNNIVWWYWAVTTLLLMGVVSGNQQSLYVVIVLNFIQVLHFILREKSLVAFPVQVRLTYFSLLIIAQLPFMFWVYWWQLIGTAAMVLFEYCFLARCMSLMAWNRNEEFTFFLLKKTFLSAPVKGNVLQGLPASN
ncbi:MAG: hypothetical protein DIZ80_08315 [endosymbiont of Galathealinum brachiosum]|uniref:Uncharacterized protein n=1 Tax=endosymbiont of Galathealinum brachiosum TaxID=2200906 RepID=A0A370DD34_9GAMM|nr:MAG: hypothetical protein DIZ80_08315 [endosymbiont of Galathealinum brachiosum]